MRVYFFIPSEENAIQLQGAEGKEREKGKKELPGHSNRTRDRQATCGVMCDGKDFNNSIWMAPLAWRLVQQHGGHVAAAKSSYEFAVPHLALLCNYDTGAGLRVVQKVPLGPVVHERAGALRKSAFHQRVR